MRFSLFSKKEIRLLAVLAFVQFSHIVDFMIMMPLGPQLMRLFQINPQHFGWLVSSYTFAAGASGFLAAFWVDRFDRKKTLIWFYIGFAMGTVACAIAPTYEFLLAARLISGGFGGVLSSLSFSIVGDTIAPEKRGTATGIVMMAFSMASVLGVPFSLYLANQWSWHAPFLFLGILSFVLFYLIVIFVPSLTGHIQHKSIESSILGPIHMLTQNPRLGMTLVFQFLLTFAQFAIIPFLAQSMVFNAGLSEKELPLIYLVGGMVSMIGSPIIGRLSDIFGKKRIYVIGAIASLIPIYLITNMGISPSWYLLGCVALFFFTMGARVIPATAIMQSSVHAPERGAFMSLASSVQQFSAAVAAAVAGGLVIKSPTGELLHYSKVGWLAIALSIATLAIINLVKPAEGKDN